MKTQETWREAKDRRLAAQAEELAGLHRQLHDERSKIGDWDLAAIGTIRARIERLDPSRNFICAHCENGRRIS